LKSVVPLKLPTPILAECREKVPQVAKGRPTNRVAAAVIVAAWLSLAALAITLSTRVNRERAVGVQQDGCYDPREAWIQEA
jgi:hypothetical protein